MRASGRWAATVGIMLFLGVVGCHARPRSVPSPVAPVPMNVDAATAPGSTRPNPAVAWSAGPFTSSAVPPRELAGVVVDDESGMPVELAQISSRGGSIAALSDSTGRFRMAMPNDMRELWVRRIGYAPYSVVVTPNADSGLVLIVALQRAPIGLCHVSSGNPFMEIVGGERRIVQRVPAADRHPGVVVIMRDVVTARAPSGSITAAVRDGSFRDSVTVRADSGDRLVASAAPDRPGRYTVTIRGDGYREWTGTGQARLDTNCGNELVPAVFHAWLTPR